MEDGDVGDKMEVLLILEAGKRDSQISVKVEEAVGDARSESPTASTNVDKYQ